ncbi:uncharacterized protein LOC124259737 [Haliotis rubra]|uniref:uncharacterized protein LOC124259737 n=1 Tax=Haliotis rubra TaxID=36100 RepID=UPI001EE5454C|nr:uncharacterized protein LOC124259737 [Haliotis rubra]
MLKLCNVAIALLGLVLAVEGLAGVPDSRCNNLPGGTGNVMADGKMCRQYLSCWDYLITGPMNCAGGSIFNSSTGDCDATECIEARTGFVDGCAFEGALPEDCSRYVVCVNDLEMQFQCGEGTYYSNELLVCVNPMEYPDIPQKQNCNYIN